MSPVVSAKDETIRLFNSDFLEFFSRVHWCAPLILFVPVILYFGLKSFIHPLSTPLTLLGFFLGGILAWTLMEYLLHRFFFHFRPQRPWLKRVFYIIHEVHHEYPGDSLRLVMPPIESVPVAILLYLVLFSVMSSQFFYPFFAGLGCGYLAYDMIHYSTHHLPMRGRVGQVLKQHHLRHHFKEENRGFGVSSPLWDFVFRTLPRHYAEQKPPLLGTSIVLATSGAFLLLKFFMGEVHPFHLLFVGAILGLYFVRPISRKLLVIALPIALYAIIYDLFRYIPFDWLKPIRVWEPFQIDQALFGILWNGNALHFHQYILQVLSHPGFDLFCGFVYLLHIPMVLILLVVFWRWGSVDLAQRFTAAFLLMNLISFLTYFFYPAAPPWYVERYGFLQPLGAVLGDAAGLVKFDQILGVDLFTTNYQISPIPFGAIPSMHAGYATLGWLYSWQVSRKLGAVVGCYAVAMYFSALYLQHHYLIDVILGAMYALVAWMVVEKLLKAPLQRMNRVLLKTFTGALRLSPHE